MADHDEEEEFLQIGIFLFSRQRSRKARKVPTSRKKNIWVRKVHLVKELPLGFIFEVGRLFIVQQVYLRTASVSFSSNSAAIVYVLERDRTLPTFTFKPCTSRECGFKTNKNRALTVH